jgi:hypothetical protein
MPRELFRWRRVCSLIGLVQFGHFVEQRIELVIQMEAVANIAAAAVGENKVVGVRPFRSQLPLSQLPQDASVAEPVAEGVDYRRR